VEAPEIDAHVREVLRSYDDAKVRSFLPVLVQRQVREILRQRALVMTLTARERDEALSQT